MKLFSEINVFDAALDRMRFIFSEFKHVVVGCSGGKDSTVTLNLALKVAEELNRLPLEVCFLDQEAEWDSVIEHIRTLRQDPRINLKWYQIPIKIENGTSGTDSYLITWEEGKEWMRELEPGSIREPVDTQVFYEIFASLFKKDYLNETACYLAGMRAEESPARFVGLSSGQTYKHITYGKRLSKKHPHYTFYPLYDWTYLDVWKAIHENKWAYCPVYDKMYQHGIAVKEMRVSNLNHETALHSLWYLPEIEKDTWNRLTKRLSGINTTRRMTKNEYIRPPKELPYMFADWKEYRDFLLEKLITDERINKIMKNKFEWMDKKYQDINNIRDMHLIQIKTILANDSWLTKIATWESNPELHSWRKLQKGQHHILNKKNKYIKK